MNASLVLLVIASLAAAMPGDGANLEPVVLAAATDGASSPYVEISDLSPAPAKRIIHARPKAETPAPQFATRQYDIAPHGAIPPAGPMLYPPSNTTVLQPVEPASTRPYIAPGPHASAIPCPCPSATTSYPTYPSAVSYPATVSPAQVTYSAPAVPQVAYMPVAQDTGLTIGRGSIGQPKLYVEGQPVRNFLRWISP